MTPLTWCWRQNFLQNRNFKIILRDNRGEETEIVVSINSDSNWLVIFCEFDFWHKWNPIVGFILMPYIFGNVINKG